MLRRRKKVKEAKCERLGVPRGVLAAGRLVGFQEPALTHMATSSEGEETAGASVLLSKSRWAWFQDKKTFYCLEAGR